MTKPMLVTTSFGNSIIQWTLQSYLMIFLMYQLIPAFPQLEKLLTIFLLFITKNIIASSNAEMSLVLFEFQLINFNSLTYFSVFFVMNRNISMIADCSICILFREMFFAESITVEFISQLISNVFTDRFYSWNNI